MTGKLELLLVKLDDGGADEARVVGVWKSVGVGKAMGIGKDGMGESSVGDGLDVDHGLHVLDGGHGDLVLLGGELDLGSVGGGVGVDWLELLGLHSVLGDGGHGVEVREGDLDVATTTTCLFYSWLLFVLLVNVREFGGLESIIGVEDVGVGRVGVSSVGEGIRGSHEWMSEGVGVRGDQRNGLEIGLDLRGSDQLRLRQHPGRRVRQHQLC